ncbi:MAG: deaminase [Alphaproteobacteria bacterium]|nr:deaminase [Alphaproteobacteria bacterium]MDP7221810.1 deaminase [Alphaproteobacteria bacterium]
MPHFHLMQKTIEAVKHSEHPTSKVAATVSGIDLDRHEFSVSCANYWPDSILKMGLARHAKIGDSSGTIHAETAAILKARITDGANIYVTDLFCPNCAKNITESGIKNVYIDHKGFDKDFAKRRTVDFESLSMPLCKRAGVSVYRLNRKERIIEALFEAPEDFVAEEENPVALLSVPEISDESLQNIVAQFASVHRGRKFAVALAEKHGPEEAVSYKALIARAHPALGYVMEQDRRMIENNSGKYSFILEPMNRILMNAARYGLSIRNGYIYSAHVPTSREQVNMLGAKLDRYFIGDQTKARDDNGHAALQMLSDHNVVTVKTL